MFRHTLRTLPARALFFVVVILLDPCPSMGMGGLFDEEERRREGGSRPLTVLQSLVVDFRRMMEEEMDPVLYCPDTPSKIQAFVLTFMREQRFSISSEQTGPASRVAIKMSFLRERQIQHERDTALPSLLSLSAYSTFMNSSRFSDFLDDSAYACLLREWQLKLHPDAPYTDFLPGISHKARMMVLAPHPLDISATREFLFLLYDALTRLNEIDPKSSVPEHEGLRKIFRVVLDHPNNRENVLSIWGLSLLERIEEFYREQRVVFAWEHTERALRLAHEEVGKSLTTIQSQWDYAWEEMRKLEARYPDLKCDEIKSKLKFGDNSPERVEVLLKEWRGKVLTKIRESESQQSGLVSHVRRLSVTQQVDYHLNIIRLKTKEHREPSLEMPMIQAALAIAEYFSSRPQIQFANPLQVRRDLKRLHSEFSSLPKSKSLLLVPVYRTLQELLTFTFPQVEQWSQDVRGLSKRLPPLALIPAEHQQAVRAAYKGEQASAVCISIYAEESRARESSLDQFESRVLGETLKHTDDLETRRFLSLQKRLREKGLGSKDQEDLQGLRNRILARELARWDSPLWGRYNIGHLTHQQEVDKAKFVHEIFKLRHRKALLGVEYIKRSFLALTLGTSEEEREMKALFDRERRKFMSESKAVSQDILRIQERARQAVQEYERKIQVFQRKLSTLAE